MKTLGFAVAMLFWVGLSGLAIVSLAGRNEADAALESPLRISGLAWKSQEIAEEGTQAKAEKAFAEKRFVEAADLYAQLLDEAGPKEVVDTLVMRLLISLAESGQHERFDKRDLAATERLLFGDASRADFLRFCADYFARREHCFLVREGAPRAYGKSLSDLPQTDRYLWVAKDDTGEDIRRAQACSQRALDILNRLNVESSKAPAAERKSIALKLLHATLDYCDLTDLHDRLNGSNSVNEGYFFGHEATVEPLKEEVLEPTEDPSDEPEDMDSVPKRARVEAPGSQPGREPFTRRGYYYEPDYDSMPAINANFLLAGRLVKDLGDADLDALVTYRRASFCITAGLYGNADLNARITNWRNAEVGNPDPALDPRPHLKRIVNEFGKSAWADEAQFLLGYVAYYLNDFETARTEFSRLEKNSPKSKYLGEAKRLLDVIDFPQCFTTLSEQGAFIEPNSRASVSVFCRNVDRVTLCLREFSLGGLLEGADPGEDLFTELDQLAKLPAFEKAIGRCLLEQSFTPDPARRSFYQTLDNIPLYTSRPGVYLLEVKAGPVTERKLIQVVDLALTRRREAGRDQFWLTTRNGSPVANAKISGSFVENIYAYVPYREEALIDPRDPSLGKELVTKVRQERRLIKTVFAGTTTALGLLPVEQPQHSICSLWASISAGGTCFLVNDRREPGSINVRAAWEEAPLPAPKPRDLRCFVYTDRPIYRPGDACFLRVIARDPSAKATLKGEPVLLIVSARGVEQFRAQTALNEFGAATVEFSIPAGSPLGDWEVLALNERLDGTIRFTLKVEEYVKRDIALKVETPQETLVPGSNVEVPVTLSFLAGGAVEGATVSWEVHAGAATGAADASSVAAGQAATNAEGRVFISLDTGSISRDFEGRAVNLVLSATAVGPGGQSVSANGRAFISGSGITVSVDWPKANWLMQRDLNLPISVRDALGKRLACSGRVALFQISGETSLRPSQWQKPSLRAMGEQDFYIAAQGGTSDLRLPATGRWRFVFEGKAEGEIVMLTHDFMIINGGTLAESGFEAVPEFESFDCIKPMRVLISNPAGGPILTSTFMHGASSEELLLPNAPVFGIHDFTVAERHAPWVNLDLRRVRQAGIERTSFGVRVEPMSRRVLLKVNFDKERYLPGEKATADIFTYNHRGEPVEAEVALSVWDSALKEFAQSALATTDLFGHFFGARSFEKVTATDEVVSENTQISPLRRHDGTVTRWRVFAMPHGSFFWGSLSWTSTRQTSFAELYESPTTGSGPSIYFEDDAKIVEDSMDEDNSVPPPSPSPTPYYGPNSESPGFGGGGGAGGKGGFAYRRARGGGGRAPGDAQGADKVRESFKDSAFFGSVQTNAKGEAQISITLPDNLTDWTFEATATDRLAGIGQTSGTFTVSKLLALRMVGPRALIEGDEVELNTLVQNLTEEQLGVAVSLDLNFDDGSKGRQAKLTLLRGNDPGSTSVAPGGTEQLRWRVKVEGFGTACLRARGQSEDLSDTLIWKYAVEPRGVQVVSIERFEFAAGQSVLEVTPDLPAGLMLDRSSMSLQIDSGLLASCVDALPHLVAYPYGCVEQTIHRFVPLLDAMDVLRAHGLTLYDLSNKRGDYGNALTGNSWPEELKNRASVQEMLAVGFGRLRGYQHDDGGWGWWEHDSSQLHNSAVVLIGLSRARNLTRKGSDLSLPASEAVLDKMFFSAADYVLTQSLAEEDDCLRNRGLMAAAMALTQLPAGTKEHPVGADELRVRLAQALRAATARQEQGGAQGQAALCLALWHGGMQREAKSQLAALLKMSEPDGQDGLEFASGGGNNSHGFDDPLEAQGLGIEALSVIDAANDQTKKALKNLMDRRTDGWWGNTRATGVAVAAIARYLTGRGETGEDISVEIAFGKSILGTFLRNKQNLISARSRFEIAGDAFAQNAQGNLRLTRKGGSPISGTITVRGLVPLTDQSQGEENGLSLKREFFKRVSITREIHVEVVDTKGRVLRRYKEMRTEFDLKPLEAGETVNVGDMVTVRLTLSDAEDRRYLAISDPRPSCLEPISEQLEDPKLRRLKGDVTREDRDSRTLFYLPHVKQSIVHLEYTAVVTCGGSFTALPALAFDMYAEDRWGRSASAQLSVK